MNRVIRRGSGPGRPRSPRTLLALPLLLPPLLALALLLTATAANAGDTSSRLERQMQLVERAIDDMLVESPNFLVAGAHVTESIDDEEGGALFIFEASLTDPDWNRRFSFRNLRWESGDKSIIVLKDGGGGKEDETIELDDADITVKDEEVTIRSKDGKQIKVLKLDRGDSDGPSGKLEAEAPESKGSARERQAAKYERAREELVTVLMDYGEFLKALPPGSPVRIVARLSDTGLPKDRVVRKLSVRASIDDLRAYGDGKLSENEMRGRVEVRES